MKTCRKGHAFRGDENYRARKGWCPVCHRANQARYERTPKARARQHTYNGTDKSRERHDRYNQSPKGWLQALADRRAHALRRRANRVTD